MNSAAVKPTNLGNVLVWDLPTRVFHWSLAVTFATAWLTSESDGWAVVHQVCGYLFAALIVFRLIWGVVGSRYARFREFLRQPGEIIAYAGSYLKGKPAHYIGHNPLGAVAIVLMLAMGAGIAASGWMQVNEIGGDAVEEVHEVLGNLMFLVVLVHIAGVVVSSILHRENLALAMVTGFKNGPADAGIRRAHVVVAVLLATALGVFGWSLAQGKLPGLLDPVAANADHGHDHEGGGEHADHDDDDD